jgi:hypothetical protein
MNNEEMSMESSKKFLDIKIDNLNTVGSADAPSFIRYLLKLSNGMSTYNSVSAEIGMLASGYPGKNMANEQKIDYLKKLERAGVNLFP